jgi:hypothetical protein
VQVSKAGARPAPTSHFERAQFFFSAISRRKGRGGTSYYNFSSLELHLARGDYSLRCGTPFARIWSLRRRVFSKSDRLMML